MRVALLLMVLCIPVLTSAFARIVRYSLPQSITLLKQLNTRAQPGESCLQQDWEIVHIILDQIVRISDRAEAETAYGRGRFSREIRETFLFGENLRVIDMMRTTRIVRNRFRAARWEASRSGDFRVHGRVIVHCEHALTAICTRNKPLSVRHDRIVLVCREC